MEIQETRRQLKERIALGLTYGLKAIEEVISAKAGVFDELIMYKSQFNDLNSFASKGLFDYTQFEIGSNKIRKGLLDLIERLGAADFKETDRLPEPKNDDVQHRRTNFFQLMRLHENNLENLKFKEDLIFGSETQTTVYTGRQLLHKVYQDYFGRAFRENKDQEIAEYCHQFFEKDRFFLEVYFKTIGFILAYIQEEEIDRAFYLGIVQSVLSRQELAFIFYYCVSDVQPGFRELVQKSKLLDSSIKSKLISEQHYHLFTDQFNI